MNEKGFTLVELIVTIAILAIIVVPFISTLVYSTQNNMLTEQVMDSATISQQLMEDIKARPAILQAEAIPELLHDDGGISLITTGTYVDYIAKYRIEKYSTGTLTNTGVDTQYSSFTKLYNGEYTDMDYQLILTISTDKVTVTNTVDSTDNSYDLLNQTYKMVFNNGYTVHFGCTADVNSHTDYPYNFGALSSGVNVKVVFLDTEGLTFDLSVDVDSLTNSNDAKFYVFSQDGSAKLKLTNVGQKQFWQYNALTNTAVNQYNNTLYRITVVVYSKKDGSEVNRLVSYVKK